MALSADPPTARVLSVVSVRKTRSSGERTPCVDRVDISCGWSALRTNRSSSAWVRKVLLSHRTTGGPRGTARVSCPAGSGPVAGVASRPSLHGCLRLPSVTRDARSAPHLHRPRRERRVRRLARPDVRLGTVSFQGRGNLSMRSGGRMASRFSGCGALTGLNGIIRIQVVSMSRIPRAKHRRHDLWLIRHGWKVR